MKTMVDDQPWMIVQEKVGVFDKSSAFVCCDRRQHLLILNYTARKTASTLSASSTINIPDHPNLNKGCSTRTIDVQTVSKSFVEKKKIFTVLFVVKFISNVFNIFNVVVVVLLVVQPGIIINFVLHSKQLQLMCMIVNKDN